MTLFKARFDHSIEVVSWTVLRLVIVVVIVMAVKACSDSNATKLDLLLLNGRNVTSASTGTTATTSGRVADVSIVISGSTFPKGRRIVNLGFDTLINEVSHLSSHLREI